MNKKLQDVLSFLKQLLKNYLSKKSMNPDSQIIPDEVAPPAPASIPLHVSLIPAFARGIFEAEGNGKQYGITKGYNNPGDLKFTGYTKSLGATGSGWNNLAIFPSTDAGISACEQLCRDAANDLLIGYPKPCTIQQFVKVYGSPVSQLAWDNYVSILCKHTGKTPTTLLSDLL